MTFILKTTEHVQGSPVTSDNEHSLYADIVSVHFRREPGLGAATARVWLREPVKTADVPGYVEVEKLIGFTGMAYVMNEAGKTVSSFAARTSGDPERDDNVANRACPGSNTRGCIQGIAA